MRDRRSRASFFVLGALALPSSGVAQAIRQGAEFQVNTYSFFSQSRAEVTAEPDGDFVVVWFGPAGLEENVFGQRFSSGGDFVGAEFRVNAHTLGRQRTGSVAALPGGDFVVVWRSAGDPPGGLLVFRFLFGFSGAALTAGAAGSSCARCDPPGIAAHLDGLDLDVDADGALSALSDGLLILRFLFGLTGEALTTGAVDDGCTRCDADAIVLYLAALDG